MEEGTSGATNPTTAIDERGPTEGLTAESESQSQAATAEEADRTLAQQIADNEHQMYLRSQQHIQEIENEVRETQPLVSDKEDIITLVLSYDINDSPEYFRKASELSNIYSHIRRIRGDGNCFYRAVLTAQLERCFHDRAELTRFTEICKGWRQKLFNFGFPELTTADFCDAMDVLLDSFSSGTKNTLQILFDDLNVDGIANYYVAFTRLICSGYLRENEALYSGFIEGARTLDQYCKEEIEPMWKECDHICIIALVNAIKVPIRIEYMDQTQAPNGGWHHDFGTDESNTPKLFFLYRPGHYDILYPTSTV
ncbi:peptidase c65 otubain domain-containing protein [Ditylenchus destructor]|uniref:Ubiquitin thioesterase n=1 Tax=Ditylenchus destructor TaxID=166010 RepID=A0AAD4NF16_9BILA|nr:peptidase c65 otubain domain-containing protein [Ditylenchus destructor]